jgi:hypothetical protein
MLLLIGMSYIDIVLLMSIPSIPSFITAYHEKMLSFVENFFCVYQDDNVGFLVASVNITVNDLHIFNYPCIPGMKST